MMNGKAAQAEKILGIVAELGAGVSPGGTMLDFGCGRGELVREMRSRGYRAFGCDIEFLYHDDSEAARMLKDGVIRMIDQAPYRLPFEDDTFDLVFSYQVFEHVQNYGEAAAEIARVLKPRAAAFHIFTPRHVPLEPHVHVPLATMIRSLPWLRLWAVLGIRNEFQAGLSAGETARRNREYLASRTNYPTKANVREHFEAHFDSVVFCEKESLRYAINRKGAILYAASRYLPVIPWIVGTFGKRALLVREPHKPPAKGSTK